MRVDTSPPLFYELRDSICTRLQLRRIYDGGAA